MNIDSYLNLFPLEKSYKDEDIAKSVKRVSHFTDINAAIKIISCQKFLCKTLNGYLSEEKFTISCDAKKNAFFTSFSYGEDNTVDMLAFLKNKHIKQGNRCKLDFYFKSSFYNAFQYSGAFECLHNRQSMFQIARYPLIIPNSISGIWFAQRFVVAEYTDNLVNKTDLYIVHQGKTQLASILPEVGRYIKMPFNYQREIRIIWYLVSGSEHSIPDFEKIYIPFLTNEIEKVVISVEPTIDPKYLQKLGILEEQFPWFHVNEKRIG